MKLAITGEKMFSFALALLAAYAAMLIPADALASFSGSGSIGGVSIGVGSGGGGGGSPSAISGVLCNVVGWFNGPIGGGIATLAIIVVGIGALMGKVSWGMAIIVGLGVGVIFGASTIVTSLGGTAC